MSRRGPYSKSAAKREEILSAALDLISRHGYRGTSVKAIAASVGLSPAGVLHHFGTKESLFVEVLKRRDELDAIRARTDSDSVTEKSPLHPLDSYAELVDSNSGVPGLVELYSAMAVEAADPSHEAHVFFADRRVEAHRILTKAVRRMQEDGRLTTKIDAGALATALHALADGLQTLWLVDPDVDMGGTVTSLLHALRADLPEGADEP
ncbi:helix-turn-helix domain-containing protein [Nocardiopsis tropica]|uniref:Helix-turn-helix domain-containing protein n=1 Tax=Nocardiopsis tropica TaxID=109330 RepID=A0ABU7KKQ5_9ACTN|nr:helix-turn-helix domain-containing protein [Nocardiopsis umidischolae]MEE2049846.1 helix-turn-helix domain-containing protein [Nocardiopsis umidischolae]